MQEFILKSEERLLVKEADRKDAARVIAYCQVIGGETDYLSFGEGEFDISLEEEKKILSEYKEAENKLFIYAELNGEIVGLLDLKASHKARIRHSGEFGISVMKQHLGKGIGGILIEYMLDWAKKTGIIKKVNLHVISNNESAINLYRKYDFTMEGRIRKEFYINGEYFDLISMGYWIE